jgi:hypothetical protein
MRYGYWCVAALLGLALIGAPIVGRFTSFHPAAYTDVILGTAIVVWALVGYERLYHDLAPWHHFMRF